MDFVSLINEINDEDDIIDELYILIEDILLISQQGLDRLTSINTSDDLLFLMEELVDKIGYDKLAATYEQYNQRENIERILASTAELLTLARIY